MVMEQLSKMGFTHYELMNMKGASYESISELFQVMLGPRNLYTISHHDLGHLRVFFDFLAFVSYKLHKNCLSIRYTLYNIYIQSFTILEFVFTSI